MENNVFKRTLRYFTQSVINPTNAFKLLSKEHSFIIGFLLMFAKWFLCEFYVLYLFLSNQELFAKPWLNIPSASYRFYELFFYIPFGVLLWILNSGIIHILAVTSGGKGSFKDSLNINGIAVFTPFVFIDTIDVIFMIINGGNWNILFNSITRSIFVIYGIILLSVGIHTIYNIRWIKSIIISILCSGIGTLICIIFIR